MTLKIHSSKLNLGWIIIILLSIAPTILWLLISKNISLLNNFQNIIISLGKIFGLVGIVIFSINLILTTRLPFIERLFNGLNNVYQKHNLLGQIAFILLIFHPLFLLLRYTTNLNEVTSFLFLSNSWARNFGIIALGIMIILIILTLYLRPKYNIWKITHKFFGVALFLGTLHVYFIPSYLRQNLLLKSYVLGLAILGIIAFLYKSIFYKFLVKTHQYIVENINQLNNDIVEISLKPINKQIQYNPGQFAFVSFKQKGISTESHPFSISSVPSENYLKITIKKLGDFTERLIPELHQGTLVEIEGPYGTFSYNQSQYKNQIWVAGGIGITPFISFIKDLKNQRNYSIQLFYCIVNKTETIYLNLLKDIENNLNNNFSVIPFYSKEKGHINTNHLLAAAKDINKKDIFICAPLKMVTELKKELLINGVNKSNIHTEEFNF